MRKTIKKYDLLFVGRLSREKGILQLLDILEPTISIGILGNGPLAEEIADRAKSSGNIEYLGFVSNDKIKSVMRRARYLIIPSVWYENNPVIVMEAYSVGLPVIGSRIGGIPEILEDSRTGFLIEMKNREMSKSIISEAVALNDIAYQQMREIAFSFYLNNFTLDTHVESLLEIYNDVLDGNNAE